MATQKKARISTDTKGSDHRGLRGIYEKLLRRFRTGAFVATFLPMLAVGGVILATALAPAVAFYRWVQGFGDSLGVLAPALGLGIGYFIYGLSLLCVLPVWNRLLVGRNGVGPFRGSFFSVENVRWFIHNSLTYLARYTFLEFVTPSPFNTWFYSAMGMRIGQGTFINTTHVSDPCLIELGEKVTIGGSATIFAHYGQSGYLVIAPVKIGDGAVIGLRAIVFGGVEIGAGARVLANSVVLPKTVIPAGETWGGIPARKLDPRELEVNDRQAA